MIVLFGAEKGGTGKTTLATNIAAACVNQFNDTLLLDADMQGSATNWIALRDAIQTPGEKHTGIISSVQKSGAIDREVDRLQRRYDNIIIDAGGRDSVEMRSATLIADFWYIPVLPSQYDFWTMSKMDRMAGEALKINPSLKVKAVINRAPTNPSIQEVQEAKEIVDTLEHISLSEITIKERIAYRKSAKEGQGVTEFLPRDTKAIDEIIQLYREIWGKGEE